MRYKIIEKEKYYVLERTSIHSVHGGSNNESIPAFWAKCHEDGTIERLVNSASDKTNIYGICYGQKAGEDTFCYSVAVLCEGNSSVPEGFRKTLIPASCWAVFECVGAMPDAIQNMWQKIGSEFFPKSDFSPSNELDIEVYPDGDTNSDGYISEIRIPVRQN